MVGRYPHGTPLGSKTGRPTPGESREVWESIHIFNVVVTSYGNTIVLAIMFIVWFLLPCACIPEGGRKVVTGGMMGM